MKRPTGDSPPSSSTHKTSDIAFPDPVEETGCSPQNDAILLCFDRTKDWRKCKPEMEAFKTCFQEYQRRDEERVVERVAAIIDEAVEEAKRKVDARYEAERGSNRSGTSPTEYELEAMAPIPFSTEE